MTTFFNLEECMDILCLPEPSPLFIAQLLQVSKRIRHLVWRFLINPEKGYFWWVRQFCALLWEIPKKGLGNAIPIDFVTCPVFISPKPEKGGEKETYYVAQQLDIQRGFYVRADVFDCDVSPPVPYKTYMARDTCMDVPKERVFRWFVVARALNIRFDKMIHKHDMNILNAGGFVYQGDRHLFIR